MSNLKPVPPRNLFDDIKIKLGLKSSVYPTLEYMKKQTKHEIVET